MKTRKIGRRHLPLPSYQPYFLACLEPPAVEARHAWTWAAVSSAFKTGKTSVRTSFSRLTPLADGNRKTVAEHLRRLQDADLAEMDEIKEYTSFRLRLRIGPGGPFYEGGKDYRRGELEFFRAPHFLIGSCPDLIPEAKVLWCWACSLPHGSQEEPRRPSGFGRPFDFSYYKERKAIEQLEAEGFLYLSRKKNSIHIYSAYLPADMAPVEDELDVSSVRAGAGGSTVTTRSE